MKLKSICTSIAAAASLLVSYPALSSPPNGGGADVHFQIFQATGDLLFRVMEDKFCARYNLRCHGVRVGSGPAGIEALAGGSLQVSFITTDAAIRAITGGAPVKIAEGLGDRVPFYLVARSKLAQADKGKGYPALMQAFRGKRIGVTGRGAGTEIIARLLLKHAGIPVQDVTFVAVGGPPTAFGALKSGQIDAAVEVPPTAEICDYSTVCGTVLNLPQEDKNIPFLNRLSGTGVVALMATAYVKEHPQVVAAWLAASKDASAWMHDPKNFDELMLIAKKYIPLKIPHANAILHLAVKRYLQTADIHIRPGAVEAYVHMLYGMKLVPKKLTVAQLVFPFARHSGEGK